MDVFKIDMKKAVEKFPRQNSQTPRKPRNSKKTTTTKQPQNKRTLKILSCDLMVTSIVKEK